MKSPRKIALAAICLLICAGHTAPSCAAEGKRGTDSAPRVIAYVTGWRMPANINAEKLTHINFAFARIDGKGKVFLPQPDMAAKLVQLRALKAKKRWQVCHCRDADAENSDRRYWLGARI